MSPASILAVVPLILLTGCAVHATPVAHGPPVVRAVVAPPGVGVAVRRPLPVARVVVRPPRPGPTYVWRDGRWVWKRGRHVRVAGAWVRRL